MLLLIPLDPMQFLIYVRVNVVLVNGKVRFVRKLLNSMLMIITYGAFILEVKLSTVLKVVGTLVSAVFKLHEVLLLNTLTT